MSGMYLYLICIVNNYISYVYIVGRIIQQNILICFGELISQINRITELLNYSNFADAYLYTIQYDYETICLVFCCMNYEV